MIVADAHVILRGLRSSRGASHRILRGMVSGELDFAMSPAVLLEYEDVLGRPGILGRDSPVSRDEIEIILDGLCRTGVASLPWFRFRPFLDDPKDDIYIECALAAGAQIIVSEDRHFRNPAVAAFGLRVLGAAMFESDWRAGRVR